MVTSVPTTQTVQEEAEVELALLVLALLIPLVVLVGIPIFRVLPKVIHWVAVGQRVEVMVIYLGITLSLAVVVEAQAK